MPQHRTKLGTTIQDSFLTLFNIKALLFHDDLDIISYKIHLKLDAVHNKQTAIIIIKVDSFGIKRLRWLILHTEKSLDVSL